MAGITEDDYLGVLVRESLKHPDSCDAKVIGSKQTQSWTLLLVRLPANELGSNVDASRADLHDGPWYAHYFRGEDLVVVYPDAVFHAGLHPSTWAEVVAHGRRRGIPSEQLDFEPRTSTDAAREFDVELNRLR